MTATEKDQETYTLFSKLFCPFVRKNIHYFFYSGVFILRPRPKGFMGKNDEKIYKVYSIFFIVFCGAGLYYIPSTTLLLCKNSNFVTKDFMPFLSFLYEVHKVSMHQQKITIASLVQQYIFIRTVSF